MRRADHRGIRRRAPSGAPRVAAMALVALVVACGGPDIAAQLAEANERVREIEGEVEAARQTVEQEKLDLAAAQAELSSARERLREAEERLSAARAQVAEVTDDAYLFRQVQSALLTDPELKDVAVSARVKDRVVTLEGRVSTLRQHERAEALATATAGVERVDNRIVVESGDSET